MTELLISVPVSPGELIDKITILRIKAERISDPTKLANVSRELQLLDGVLKGSVPEGTMLEELTVALQAVNEELWDIEDEIRLCEGRGDFGPDFVKLARAVYVTNDRRATLKKDINQLLGSTLIEEKSYADYVSQPSL